VLAYWHLLYDASNRSSIAILGQALKLLLTFVKNVSDHPEEMK
jgi:hypothetical protein